MTTWNKQIENRNFLSPIGFKFTLAKFPKVSYFCQSANIPSMNLNIQQQPTPFRSLPLEGFIEYDPLNISFLIDEDLENFMIIHNWIRGLGTPDGYADRVRYNERMKPVLNMPEQDKYGDATLIVLNSNFKANFEVVFKDLYPMSISALEFNASVDGTEYAMGQVSFRYTGYEVRTADTSEKVTKLS